MALDAILKSINAGRLKTIKFDTASLFNVMLKSLEVLGLDLNPIAYYSNVTMGPPSWLVNRPMVAYRSYCKKKITQKDIPYIHCLNHQLHLVVILAIGENDDVRKTLDVCKALYKFVRRLILSHYYESIRLKHLLEERWSGHLSTITAVIKKKTPAFN